MSDKFKVICLTGGPCGGKTSSVSILSDLFVSLGWRVYRLPETATILFGAGVSFPDLNEQAAYSVQKSILRCMLAVEDSFRELAAINARDGIKTVLICDRGAMDPSAYMPSDQWLKMLHEMGLEEVALRDHRYDCIIHLVTAAKGAEAFYSNQTNLTRTEGVDLARDLDTSVMNAWVGHASLQVIDNISCQNFKEKCDRVVQAVSTRLGLTQEVSKFGSAVLKKKYLISNFDFAKPFPVKYRDFMVEHRYLVNTSGDGTQQRIRRREEIGTSTSVHLNMTVRHPSIDGQRVETRRNLSNREYETLKSQADISCHPVIKLRRCFLFKDRYFQMDSFESPQGGLILLEGYIYDDSMGNKESIPVWLGDVVDVTDDKNYSMFRLSQINDTGSSQP